MEQPSYNVSLSSLPTVLLCEVESLSVGNMLVVLAWACSGQVESRYGSQQQHGTWQEGSQLSGGFASVLPLCGCIVHSTEGLRRRCWAPTEWPATELGLWGPSLAWPTCDCHLVGSEQGNCYQNS